jgi:hypothetical protein
VSGAETFADVLAANETYADGRDVARQLWDLGSYPGAAPMAVKISEALSASAAFIGPIDITEREYGALRQALPNEQADPSSA